MNPNIFSFKSVLAALTLTAGLAWPVMADAALKNVVCVKTNTGQYFPVVRVSMMVVPDGGSTFEIVLKDGEGEANVQSISFEKHNEEIDFNDYKGDNNDDGYIDLTKKIYLITSTGKYMTVASMPEMRGKEGSSLFDVVADGTTVPDVESVFFYRGDDPDQFSSLESIVAEEQLQLMTPISQQMTLSGCGDARKAVVFGMNGSPLAEAPVNEGICTLQVGHLTPGAYVVKVGKKALKFIKQ